MMSTTSIEFLKNLAQYDYDGKYYDLHNDYDFLNMLLHNGTLSLKFKSVTDTELLSLEFKEVEIAKMEYFNVRDVAYLTLDTLYRGRVEINGELKEVSEVGKGYFYLEFYEGQKLEFWSKEFCLLS